MTSTTSTAVTLAGDWERGKEPTADSLQLDTNRPHADEKSNRLPGSPDSYSQKVSACEHTLEGPKSTKSQDENTLYAKQEQEEEGNPNAPEISAPSTSSTTPCNQCNTLLSFPPNVVYIQCPMCTNTMNMQKPQLSYTNCMDCGTLLSHPPSATTIQCPKCMCVLELTHPLQNKTEEVDHNGRILESQDGRVRKHSKPRKDPNAQTSDEPVHDFFERKASETQAGTP